FRQFGITLELTEVFRRFKGVKLYEIIDTISKEHGVALAKAELARLALLRAYPRSELLPVLNFVTMPGLVGPILGPVLGGVLVTW
ncbi:hypothetical protein ONJ45_26030, partial [Salmonella enterica subsp. enterica serovar Virginia]|nr:hypothetical protein [Salmonella enterica subsp. enterica serovar Virginia]